ncbi:MAG TPA: metallophosphatase, partial [Thermoanaerobaculia bacterium]
RQIAAGCLYEHDRYPNACERIRIVLDGSGRPLRYDLWFRGWSTRGFWFNDNSLYSGTVDGRLSLWVRGQPDGPSADPRVARVFVGREPEIEQLEKSLLGEGASRPVAICSVQGMAGVGKSYLAERFAYLHQDHFPGGVCRLVLDGSGAPVSGDSLLGNLGDRLRLPQATDGLAEWVRSRLLSPRSLLHVENVDAEPLARAAAELIVQLAGCPILVTGRYQALGSSLGWIQVPVRPFDEATALVQLAEELGEEMWEVSEEYQRLVGALGFLPLAIHLAAGYLKAGYSVEGFLTRLRQTGFALPAADVAEPTLTRDQSRAAIASAFALSLDLLKAQLGAEGERLIPGFLDLGHAPPVGFGASLGAAIAGLPALDYEQLAVAARRLSLLDPIPPAERKDRAYRLHPLLAELLRSESGKDGAEKAHARMTEWFCARLPQLPAGQEEEQGKLWREIQVETGALPHWLAEIREAEGVRVGRAGSWFATLNGPFHAWFSFYEELLRRPLGEEERSNVLWTLGRVALHSGDLDRAAGVAREKVELDRSRGDEKEAALATGTLADVLWARGDLNEALRIQREEVLPVFERLGDIRNRAATMGKIADVLQYRAELKEVLRIRREEQLPVYERLGDAREHAVTMGKIADVLQVQGELDEAIRIRLEEELTIYERLGLGASRDMAAGRFNLARTYLKRNHAGDREAAIALLSLALESADRLGIPETKRIRLLLEQALNAS